VALDSTFAAAYANMPYMYVQLANTAPDVAHAREFKRLADSMARTAIRLDPLLPEAHTALGAASLIGLSDLATGEREFRRSIALGGSPRVHEHLAIVLSLTGREKEALDETMRSAKDDPLSATARAELGKILCLNRRYDEGLAELARVARLRPPLLRVASYMATCYGMQGRWRDAVEQLRDRRRGRLAPMLGYMMARAGDTTEAKAIRDELLARWRTHQRGAFGLAIISAGLGDLDQSLEWLDRAVDDLTLDAVILSPILPELRADPRFDRFVARLGVQKR
jgi:tetratricopeptide (TPR) repeat protein